MGLEAPNPTAGAGAIPPTVTVQNGPCSKCKHWISDALCCEVNKTLDEDMGCAFVWV